MGCEATAVDIQTASVLTESAGRSGIPLPAHEAYLFRSRPEGFFVANFISGSLARSSAAELTLGIRV
jgi:hypothetical protein